MDTLKTQIGYYTSMVNLISTLLFGVSFFALFLISPSFEWTSLPDYVNYCQANDQSLKHLAQALMIVFSVSLLILITLIDDGVLGEEKFFSRLGVIFLTISTPLISLGYFIQITAVRWNFETEQLAGLEHFIQFYPHSAILSVIMLGYTLFLGLGLACMIPVFSGKEKTKLIRIGLWVSATSCLLGFIGFIFQIIPLILLASNFGNGMGFILLGIGLLQHFRTRK